MPRSPARARARTAVTVVVVGALAYGAGLVTGVVGSAPSAAPVATGVLDEAASRIESRASTPVDREALTEAAVDGMLRSLGDRWSTYYTVGDFGSFSQSLEGRYAGIGTWVHAVSGGGVVIGSVTPDSPAAVAGVRSGDRLKVIDGTRTQGRTVAAVATLLRGEPGTVAVLALNREGVDRVVRVQRANVSADDVAVAHGARGVTVVRVAAFTRGVGTQVRDAVADAADASSPGVVLDLRGNPGGLLTEAVEVASAFLAGGPVVSYERRGEGPTRLDAIGAGEAGVPLVVLVDGGTASASEVVAGALQDRHRAVVVGQRTFGKGSVQEPSRLSDGSAIELTVGRYLTPNGRSIDGVGIEPDVLVDSSAPSVAQARAVEVLAGLQASVPTSGRG